MRLLTFSAISALALTAAACAPHVKPTERTSLDCPDRQGRLTLTSRAANGKTCVYRSDDVDVTLELIPVSGSPDATLKTIASAGAERSTTRTAR